MTATEVERVKREGYRPAEYLSRLTELRDALDVIGSGLFSRGATETFKPLIDSLTCSDPFLVLADFEAYVACQAQVDAAWQDQERWTRMSILNTARSGKFSSDRAIAEYCRDIWNLRPVEVAVNDARSAAHR